MNIVLSKILSGLLFKIVKILIFGILLLCPILTNTMNLIDSNILMIESPEANCIRNYQTEKLFTLDKIRNGEKKLTILHIGDSHIQADIFTGEVRRLLSEYFHEKNLSRGFCFPFSIVGSNNPDDLITKSSGAWFLNRKKTCDDSLLVGIAGVSLETNDALSTINFKLKTIDSCKTAFNQIKIYFDDDSTSYKPTINFKEYTLIKEPHCYTFLVNSTFNFELKLEKENCIQRRFILYGIELNNNQSNIIYHSVGVNGADVKTFLNNKNLEDQIKKLEPQIVIVSIGTNDSYNQSFNKSAFRESLSQLVNNLRKDNPNNAIIFTTPGDHFLPKRRVNPNIKVVCNIIDSVATIKGCMVWDFNSIMGSTGSIGKWAKMGLTAPDHLHLNKQGYKLQGSLFYSALVDLFEKKLD